MNGSIVTTKLTTIASSSSNFLRKLSEPVWKILSFNLADDTIYPARTLSASIGKGLLSAVYGSRFLSRIKIEGIREFSFDEDRFPQPEVFASSLALALNDLGASKAEISLGIPKAWAIIKTAEFPVTVKENLEDVISFELDRLTPLNPEDALYDFKIIGEDAGKLAVMIVAAKADLVRPYIGALAEKGITVGRVTVNLCGLETLCRYAGVGTDTVFIEITKEGFEGALFFNGTVSAPVAGSFTSDDDKARADMIINEISPLFQAMQGYGRAPSVLLLLKDGISPLRELLRTRINHPLRILNETDIKLRYAGEKKEIPYAAAGGVLESLWPKAEGFNLLKKGAHGHPKYPKTLTIILFLLLVSLWVLYIIAPLSIEGKRLDEIDRQIAMRKEEVKKVGALKKEEESLNKEIALINNFKRNRPLTLDILKELTVILPKNAWLTRVRIADTTVNLEGYAASATGLLPKLEASPRFNKAEFASPTFRDTRMNADRFNIKMEIEGYAANEDLIKSAAGDENEEE
jgi:Tfp pilus assembly protein PilN